MSASTPLTYDEWAEMCEVGAKLPRSLTMRERRMLDDLASQKRSAWLRPMDLGGGDGSHHCNTLHKLITLGLVERKKYHAIYCYFGTTWRQTLVNNRWTITKGHPPYTKCCCKGSCRYRATLRGRRIYKR